MIFDKPLIIFETYLICNDSFQRRKLLSLERLAIHDMIAIQKCAFGPHFS